MEMLRNINSFEVL